MNYATTLLEAYINVSVVATLLHVLSMVWRKHPAPTILRVASITFVAWPLLPIMYWKYRQYLAQQKTPLEQRDSSPAMLLAVRKHFDEMPFIVVAYDPASEKLHFYSSTSQKGRAALLKHATAANETELTENPDGNH